jgi:heme/copper-type cytochrome/quinol oxidase subunit 2
MAFQDPKNYNILKKSLLAILEMIGHEITIEIIWTIFHSIILMFIVIPSFGLLYSMDKIINPTIIIQSFWLIERQNKNIFI